MGELEIQIPWPQLQLIIPLPLPVTGNMASNNILELPELATSFEVNSYLALNPS